MAPCQPALLRPHPLKTCKHQKTTTTITNIIKLPSHLSGAAAAEKKKKGEEQGRKSRGRDRGVFSKITRLFLSSSLLFTPFILSPSSTPALVLQHPLLRARRRARRQPQLRGPARRRRQRLGCPEVLSKHSGLERSRQSRVREDDDDLLAAVLRLLLSV